MVARTVSFFVASEGESRPIVVISSLDSLLESSVPRFHSTVPPEAPLEKVAEESLGACTEITVRGDGSVTVTCPLCTPATPTLKARTWTPKFVPDFAVSGASTVSRTTDRFPVVVSELSLQPTAPTRPRRPAARQRIRKSFMVPPESRGGAKGVPREDLPGTGKRESHYNPCVLEPLRARRVGYPAAVLLVLTTIGILKLFPGLADSSVALLLLLSVFLAAWIWESGPGALAAVLATLGFNFFFIPPVHTFTVEDPRNVVALFVFLLSGLRIGRLSDLARRRLRLVEAERADLAALTRLSQAFLSDTNQESLLDVAADRLRDALGAKQVAILLADEDRNLSRAASPTQAGVKEEIAERVYRQGSSAAFQSELGGTDLYISIPVGVQRTGVLVAIGMKSNERLAEGCAVLLGLALERERFLRMARAAEETKASDEMK